MATSINLALIPIELRALIWQQIVNDDWAAVNIHYIPGVL